MRRLNFLATGDTRKPFLSDTEWLAMVLAIFALGLGMVVWEWHHAHAAVPNHASEPAPHHDSASATAATTSERNQ